MLAGSSCLELTGVSYSEAVGLDTLNRFLFPIEVYVFVHLCNGWRTFHIVAVVIFTLQTFWEQNLVRTVCRFRSDAIYFKRLVETSYEVTCKFTTGITLVTYTTCLGNVTFDFVSFRNYTEVVFKFATWVVDYDMSLFCCWESESQHTCLRNTCQFGLDVVVLQHNRVVVRLCNFFVVRILRSAFVRTAVQFAYHRHDGDSTVFRHGCTVRIVAGTETLKKWVRRVIRSVGLSCLRG